MRNGGGGRSLGSAVSSPILMHSGCEGELVLLDGLLDPSAESCLLEGLHEGMLGVVVLHCRLLGLMV